MADEPTWISPDGIEVPSVLGPADIEALRLADTKPGVEPYLRGIYPTMYATKPWTIRQYAGFSTAEESNAFYRAALADGQTGLSVAFDLPTHRGYDSDHPRVTGDVGKAGVAIDTVEDMRVLFGGIDLAEVSVSMTMNGAVLPIMACFVVAAEEQGVDARQLSGTIQNDILKEFITRNTYIYPPEPSMRIVADVIAWCSDNAPRFNSVSISGYHFHEAGATTVQELVFTLADGLEYVRAALARGLTIDQFAPRLSFFFGVGMNFFAEVCKLRAARQLWSELIAQFEPSDPRSSMLRVHCQTSGVSLTEEDPYNNVVRTAYEALAAVLGGTQSLHTNSFDEAIALPSDEAARVARHTQLILAEETEVTHVVDPLGGSYYVEWLTAQLVKNARVMISEIEDGGGMVAAIESGMPKRRIEESATRRQARIDRGEDVIVGVNRHRGGADPEVVVRKISNTDVLNNQLSRLDAVKHGRNAEAVDRALGAVSDAAQSGSNLLVACIDAARQRATVGEMSLAMEEVFGRYAAESRGVAGVYAGIRGDDPAFVEVRQLVADFAKREGRQPRILVAKLGQDGHDRGALVVASAFRDLGFDVDIAPLFQTPAEVARAAIDNDVHVVGISSQAGAHDTLVPQLIAELKSQGSDDVVVVVGGVVPESDRALLKQAGVAEVFEPGSDLVEVARIVLADLGP